MSREILARHSLASYSEGERMVVLGLAPATIKNRLREAREQGLLMLGILSTLVLYDVAEMNQKFDAVESRLDRIETLCQG